MKKLVSILVNTVAPLLVIGTTIWGYQWLMHRGDEGRPGGGSEAGAPGAGGPSRGHGGAGGGQGAGGPGAALLVEAIEARGGDFPVVLYAQGTVAASREVVLQPQVSGRIVSMHPNLVTGGRIASGEELFRLEQRDYQLALELERNNLDQAIAQRDIEMGRQEVASREWELFRGDASFSGEDAALALREPQLRSSELAVATAEARVDRARLDLSRTVVTAPFDAVVKEESVEIGQLVTAQTQVVRLAGTETGWVLVTVPTDRLDRIRLPDATTGAPGAPARVTRAGDPEGFGWDGTVVRILPEVDTAGRNARIVVEIPRPFDTPAGVSPLLLGSYVEVAIGAGMIPGGVEIPRGALRDGARVFVVGPDRRLQVRDVEVAWRNEETLILASGVGAGEQVVTSRVGVPVDGMPVRLPGDDPAGSGRGDGAPGDATPPRDDPAPAGRPGPGSGGP